jgi:hypothetical protein
LRGIVEGAKDVGDWEEMRDVDGKWDGVVCAYCGLRSDIAFGESREDCVLG